MAHSLDTESYECGWMDAAECKKLTRESLLSNEKNEKYREELWLYHIKIGKIGNTKNELRMS